MDNKKRKALEEAGWNVGSASDFLGLTPQEMNRRSEKCCMGCCVEVTEFQCMDCNFPLCEFCAHSDEKTYYVCEFCLSARQAQYQQQYANVNPWKLGRTREEFEEEGRQ